MSQGDLRGRSWGKVASFIVTGFTLIYPLLIWLIHQLDHSAQNFVYTDQLLFLFVIGIGVLTSKFSLNFILFMAAIIGFSGWVYGEGTHWERSYPVLVSLSTMLLLAGGGKGEDSFLEIQVKKFRKLSLIQSERLGKTITFWTFGLSLNILLLTFFLFYGSDEYWITYGVGGSYFSIGLMIAGTVGYVHGSALFEQIKKYVFQSIYAIHHTFSFFLFGVMCVIGTPVVCILLVLCGGLRPLYRSMVQWLCWRCFRFVRWYTSHVRFIDMKIIDQSGGNRTNLLACSHLCMFDIVSLLAEFQNCLTFVQGKFLQNPLLWPFITSSGYIAVKRGDLSSAMKAYQSAKNLVSSGKLFAVFPEGSRSRSGELGPLKDGVFKIAFETGTDLTPVFFTMNRPFLTGGAMYTYDLRCVNLYAYVQPPIRVRDYNIGGDINRRNSIAKMKEEYRRQYQEFIESDLALDWNRENSPFRQIAVEIEK